MAFVKSLEKAISQLGPLLQGLRMVLEHRRDVTSKSTMLCNINNRLHHLSEPI